MGEINLPLVTNVAQVALVEKLPAAGVDFLLDYELAGGRIWVQPSSEDVVLEQEEPEVHDSVNGSDQEGEVCCSFWG